MRKVKIVEGVRRIKAKDGPDLIVWGSSTLTPVLLEHGLADEVLLLIVPVLLGKGKRFFSDRTPPCELALVGTKAVSSGVIISTYRPSGPLRIGSFDDAAVGSGQFENGFERARLQPCRKARKMNARLQP
jgi:hypothetical protein